MASNNSSCDTVLSVPLLRVICTTNAVSVVVCLLASAMVFGLKLHQKVVYRLALYQILAALVFSVVQMSQIAFVHYNVTSGSDAYAHACYAIAFLSLYTQWAKLVLTTWLTAHLFCFSVFQKNLKRLEVVYVVTSLLVPAALAGVALGIRSYGLGEFGCWISSTCRNGNFSFRDMFFERLGLWDGPAASILLIASVAMVIMLIKLAVNVHQRRRYAQTSSGDQFWKALKQLLPLAAFPVLFYIFVIPQFAFHIYQLEFQATNYQLPRSADDSFYVAISASFSVWSFVSGLTLILHVCVARMSQHCRNGISLQDTRVRPYGAVAIDDEGSSTVRPETASLLNSTTSFPLPTESA